MYLYHATPIRHADSIENLGILPNQASNWGGMKMWNCVYLALNPEAAISYVEASDSYDGRGIAVFSVDLDELDAEKLGYDWNNRCEYHKDINSVCYSGEVFPEIIHRMTDTEVKQTEEYDIDDFEGTDLYEKIMSVFEEKVETNVETA